MRKNRQQVKTIWRLLGNDKDFGTKNPIRMIKDILKIQNLQDEGILLLELMENKKIKTLKIQV